MGQDFSPACLSTLFRVPGARSSLGFPGTVTLPGLVGCLNFRVFYVDAALLVVAIALL
jgi:hypothetical protein